MRGIEKRFDATVALAGVDLAVAPGEVCGLVGENGAGKSTLMAILSGALEPDGGTMTLDGRAYAPRDPMTARRAGVAMIYQELSLAPDLSVADNILLGMEPARFGVLDRAAMRRVAADALAELGRSDITPETRVSPICRWPSSNWLKSRVPLLSVAASSCWTNRRARWAGETPSGCSR